MVVPQFGELGPEGPYPDRPVAFAVLERGGMIAVVEAPRGRRGRVIDLPGGGVDAGETEADAAVRECGEEAGLVAVLDAQPFVRADQFFRNGDDVVRNSRGAFFIGRVAAENAALKIEPDHRLLWMEPVQALLQLDRDSHAWALAVWLRLRARTSAASGQP